MIRQLRRWLLQRAGVMVADGSDTVVECLANLVRLPYVTLVRRMRLDAALSDPIPTREAGKKGRPAVKGKHQPRWRPALPDGTMLVVRRFLSAGYAFVIHRAHVPLRPCGVQINTLIQFRSWHGLSCVGRSK